MVHELVDENEAKTDGCLHVEPLEPEQPYKMLQRLLYILLIATVLPLA